MAPLCGAKARSNGGWPVKDLLDLMGVALTMEEDLQVQRPLKVKKNKDNPSGSMAIGQKKQLLNDV